MEVFIEPIEKGFRVSTGAPLDLIAEGESAEQAIELLRAKVARRLAEGRFISLDVPRQADPAPHPLSRFRGMFKDDPLFAEWQADLERYRDERENDPETL
jgi:hypothetical protein